METFHDEGQTGHVRRDADYQEVGFDGPLRPDHVPTMEGEENLAPGYDVLGRLFAIGYIKGLAEGAAKSGQAWRVATGSLHPPHPLWRGSISLTNAPRSSPDAILGSRLFVGHGALRS